MSDDLANVSALAGQIVSNQLLRDHVAAQRSIDEAIMHDLMHPPTPEQLSAKRAEREADWYLQTRAGRVGIADSSDYGGGPDWRVVNRHEWVEKWVTAEAWDRYESAREALDDAEQAL